MTDYRAGRDVARNQNGRNAPTDTITITRSNGISRWLPVGVNY